MVDETKDLDKLLKGKEGEKVMKDLREDFQEHAEGLGDHLEEIKGHTSGNKALNLLQVADAVHRQRKDKEAEALGKNIESITKRQEDDFAGAHRGREDIQLKLSGINSKLNNMSGGGSGNGGGGLKMRTAVFSGSSGSNDTSVGDGVLVNEFGRPFAGSESSNGKVFGGVEKINEIKAGSMDKKALFTGMPVSNMRKEGSAQAAINNITKSFIGEDGLANSDKVNKLNDELNAGGKDTQEIFKQYIQSLRDQSAGKSVDTKKFEAQGKALKGMGEGSVLAEVGNSYKRGGFLKEKLGRAQDGSGFVKDSFVKQGGVLGKVGSLPGRAWRKMRGIPENDANEDNVSRSLKKIATNVGGGFREKERQAGGGTSSSGQQEKVPGKIVGSGKAPAFTSGIDSNNRVVELLELIEENTRLDAKNGGGAAVKEGGGFWDLGKTIATIILGGAGAYLFANKDRLFNDDGTMPTSTEKGIVTAGRVAANVAMAPVKITATAIKAGLSARNVVTNAATSNTTAKVLGNLTEAQVKAGFGGKAAKEALEKGGVEAVESIAENSAKATAKVVAKSGSQSLLKKVPFFAAIAGITFGAKRLMDGDVVGAAAEITSGFAGATGLGTPGSLAVDAGILTRDIIRMDYNKIAGDKIYDRGMFGGVGFDATLDRERLLERIATLEDPNKTIGQILADDDLNDSDEAFLRNLQSEIVKQTLPTAAAIDNMDTEQMGPPAPQEVVVLNPQAQKIEVEKVVSAIMPQGVVPKNHSFQRFQDLASQYS